MLLDVQDLKVSFKGPHGKVHAVRNLSFQLAEERGLAIVGESGCGKTVSVEAILGLLAQKQCEIKAKKISLNGQNLLEKSEDEMQKLRGKELGMIFQQPLSALNPIFSVGYQIMEGLIIHERLSKAAAKKRALELLELVQLKDVQRHFSQYPHELSGGQRQRAMIAMALACKPKILIADEPTTALDLSIEREILDLLKEIKKKSKTSLLLITHDLHIIEGLCEDVMVMYAGKAVEFGPVEKVLKRPSHPYTKALVDALPKGKNHSLKAIKGSPPDLFSLPKGCLFAPRCAKAMKICSLEDPPFFQSKEKSRFLEKSACWLHDERAPKDS